MNAKQMQAERLRLENMALINLKAALQEDLRRQYLDEGKDHPVIPLSWLEQTAKREKGLFTPRVKEATLHYLCEEGWTVDEGTTPDVHGSGDPIRVWTLSVREEDNRPPIDH